MLEAHGLFDSKGQCLPTAISVMSPVAAECWGTFFIVWDMVKTARKFVAPEAGVKPFHECIILHGPGTFRSLHAWHPQHTVSVSNQLCSIDAAVLSMRLCCTYIARMHKKTKVLFHLSNIYKTINFKNPIPSTIPSLSTSSQTIIAQAEGCFDDRSVQ